MTLEKELQNIINKHSKENKSNTPDFILAEYLNDCLKIFEKIINLREPPRVENKTKTLTKGN